MESQVKFISLYVRFKNTQAGNSEKTMRLIVWKANGNFARGSVSAFEIAPPSKGGGSCICRHTRKA